MTEHPAPAALKALCAPLAEIARNIHACNIAKQFHPACPACAGAGYTAGLCDFAGLPAACPACGGGMSDGAQPPNLDRLLLLAVSEACEAQAADRADPNAPDKHCPAFPATHIELIDLLIRTLDICARLRVDVPGAMAAKLAYNWTRPVKHGKRY